MADNARHTKTELLQMQSLPLEIKVVMTCNRIRQWVDAWGEDGVYVSFSGGKDSTVLLDLVRNVCGYKNVPAMFVDVPTQYPELREFVKTFDNVEIVKPKISFMEVCEKYGFPLISKEVAESVEGARKYARELVGDAPPQCRHYSYYYRKLTGTGEYTKPTNGKQGRGAEPKTGEHDGMGNQGQDASDTGEYP